MNSIGVISAVRIGHTFRDGVTPAVEGGIVVLQSKDMTPEGRGGADLLVRTDMGRIDPWHITKLGDVVFQPRGVRFPAMVVEGDLIGAVVASPLYLIRPNQNLVEAAYLAALINTPAMQARLKSKAKGSYIPQVPAAAIHELEIPLPSLPEQRAIAALADLAREEAQIAATLAAKRSVWLHALAVHRDGQEPRRNSRRHANASD